MTLAAIIVSEVEALGIHLIANGDKLRIEAPTGVLTSDLRDRLIEHKAELLAMLPTSADDIPQSFKDCPCYRCGGHQAIRSSEGIWVCPCYFALVELNKQPRPPLSSVDLNADRGLSTICSQCKNSATWYGAGGTAYCYACKPPMFSAWLKQNTAVNAVS